MTTFLVLINVVVFIATYLNDDLLNTFAFVPIFSHSPVRWVMPMFTHVSWWHIFANMYSLFLIGSVLEANLGKLRFFLLYIISGIGGNIALIIFAHLNSEGWLTPSVGASGCVFGLFGAFMLRQRLSGANMMALYVMMAINLVIGFIPGFHIAWQAHVGGLVCGTATMGGLYLSEKFTQTKTTENFGDVLVFIVIFTLLGYGMIHYVPGFANLF